MYIKQLIKDKEQYWDFIWPFIDWSDSFNKSLWREEDLPKLKPFFDKQKLYEEWSDEVKESFEYYKKCHEEYGAKNTELRNAVSKFTPEEILEAFDYELPEYEDEEAYTKDKPLKLNAEVSFPFVVVGDLYCGWDRGGDYQVLSIYRVSINDFNETQ